MMKNFREYLVDQGKNSILYRGKLYEWNEFLIKINEAQSGDSEKIYPRTGDPYKYKVTNNHWLAQKQGQDKWYEISGKDFRDSYQISIDILDSEFPDARTKDAPKRKAPLAPVETKLEPTKNPETTKPESGGQTTVTPATPVTPTTTLPPASAITEDPSQQTKQMSATEKRGSELYARLIKNKTLFFRLGSRSNVMVYKGPNLNENDKQALIEYMNFIGFRMSRYNNDFRKGDKLIFKRGLDTPPSETTTSKVESESDSDKVQTDKSKNTTPSSERSQDNENKSRNTNTKNSSSGNSSSGNSSSGSVPDPGLGKDTSWWRIGRDEINQQTFVTQVEAQGNFPLYKGLVAEIQRNLLNDVDRTGFNQLSNGYWNDDTSNGIKKAKANLKYGWESGPDGDKICRSFYKFLCYNSSTEFELFDRVVLEVCQRPRIIQKAYEKYGDGSDKILNNHLNAYSIYIQKENLFGKFSDIEWDRRSSFNNIKRDIVDAIYREGIDKCYTDMGETPQDLRAMTEADQNRELFKRMKFVFKRARNRDKNLLSRILKEG